jgi:2,4-dienoyl-CoA reductase-like NADH-dependent reductase (Old Yellow Enzyme family)
MFARDAIGMLGAVSPVVVDRERALAPLFEPFVTRGLVCRNRVAMAPMTRCFSPGGVPGEDVARYYARRAEGGVGLIFTEGSGVDHPAAVGDGGLGEDDIPLLDGTAASAGWRRVIDEVHAAGGKIISQLWHQGPLRAGGGPHPEAPSVRPSGIWGPEGRRAPLPRRYRERMLARTKPVSEGEAQDIIDAFGRSAANAVSLGFDGLAIHGAHGYLIDAFLWDQTNRRTDRFGGDLSARTTFAVEIIRACRTAAGDALPIVFRWSQWKLQDLDARLVDTPTELATLLTPLADAGVDIFDVSTREFDKPAFAGSTLTLAGWTRRVTGLPTICVGGIGLDKDLYASFREGSHGYDNVPRAAELVAAAECDLVAVGRALLLDPDWLQKARQGAPMCSWSNAAREQLI